MNKLNWKYDKQYKQWWIRESIAYANDGFVIEKKNGTYDLTNDSGFHCIGGFKLLRSAKQVAHLLKFGQMNSAIQTLEKELNFLLQNKMYIPIKQKAETSLGYLIRNRSHFEKVLGKLEVGVAVEKLKKENKKQRDTYREFR